MSVDPAPSSPATAHDSLQDAAERAEPATFCERWGLVLLPDRARLVIPKAFRSDATGFEAGWTDRDVLRALDRWLAGLPRVARRAWRLVLSGCYRWNRGPMRRGSSLELCFRKARIGRTRFARRPVSLPPTWRCRLAVERIGLVSDGALVA